MSEDLGQALGARLEAVYSPDRGPSGAPEVACAHQPSAPLEDVLDRGERLANARSRPVILLPSSGTLKSTRKKTRLFSTGRSRTVRIPCSGLVIGVLSLRSRRAFVGGGEAQSLDATSCESSTIRLENPHSLSYQEKTFANLSPMS